MNWPQELEFFLFFVTSIFKGGLIFVAILAVLFLISAPFRMARDQAEKERVSALNYYASCLQSLPHPSSKHYNAAWAECERARKDLEEKGGGVSL